LPLFSLFFILDHLLSFEVRLGPFFSSFFSFFSLLKWIAAVTRQLSPSFFLFFSVHWLRLPHVRRFPRRPQPRRLSRSFPLFFCFPPSQIRSILSLFHRGLDANDSFSPELGEFVFSRFFFFFFFPGRFKIADSLTSSSNKLVRFSFFSSRGEAALLPFLRGRGQGAGARVMPRRSFFFFFLRAGAAARVPLSLLFFFFF